MRRRRVRVGDRVEHERLGVGDVIGTDGGRVAVSFDAGVVRFIGHVAPYWLVIVDGGAS
jgi:hypothetical protein